MKRGLFFSTLLAHCALFSQNISTESLDFEEAFMVRRITEFWKDQDYSLVERQIHLFLEKYPGSSLKDYLKGILGDIYLKDRQYEKAIDVYTSIDDSAIQEKVLINTLQSMYELSRYSDIHQTGVKYLSHPEVFQDRKDEFLFLMAEGYFRSASEVAEAQDPTRLQEAKKIYESLVKSSYGDPSQFALAEIYKQTNEPQRSAELFKKLASRYQDKQEELLFHAALAESLYSPKEAIKTFAEVIAMQGAKQVTSAFNRLILLFQMESYDSVIDSIDIVLNNIDSESLPVVLYMYSRSLFGASMYDKALEVVDKLENNPHLDASQLKNLYLIELGSSQHLKEHARYEEALKKFEASFPKDKEIPKAIFIHALMLKEQLKTVEAQNQLEKILTQFADFESAESLLLEYGFITYDNEQYELSRTSLKTFIETFAKSDQLALAWRYYLSGTLQMYDLIQKESPNVENFSKIQFYSDLTWVLANSKGLSEKEIQESRFLQAKVGVDLGYTQESIQKLFTYIQDYSKHSSVSDAHLLIALCYDRLRANYEGFIEHSQKAIELAHKHDHISLIHIQIFNALLRYKESFESAHATGQNQAKKLQEIKEKATEHLYAAFAKGDIEIKQENLLWLASAFCEKAALESPIYGNVNGQQAELSEPLAKAKQILQKVLLSAPRSFALLLESTPSLEWDMMRLVQIAAKEGDLTQKQTLLEVLKDAYSKCSGSFKLRQNTLVELAKSYELSKNTKGALACFEEVIELSSSDRTIASEYAKVHKIRLELTHLDQFTPQQIEEKINYLKGLQIQKEVASEPLHLEASLVYAEARIRLSTELDKDLRNLFFLNRIKEDYSDMKDPQVAAYKTALTHNLKANALYNAYMQLIALEMSLIKSQLEENEGRYEEASRYQTEAIRLLSLMQKEDAPTHYIDLKLRAFSEMFDRG
ncbi:MAG: tetratricopeptide repeat protein [Chlamydiia bacterium]